MRYNEKYNRWFTKGGLVYRYSKTLDKLVLCKQSKNDHGYLKFGSNKKQHYVHRAVYETFVGEIPEGYQIDHINTIRDDNRLENLKLVTHKENCNNPLTKQKRRGMTWSEFGEKFKEHFGITCYENLKLYRKELNWYRTHNSKCRWEV